MKKLIAIILILAMLMPAVSIASDQDPIVGCWYVLIDTNDLPKDQQKANEKNVHLRGEKMELHVFWFTENGEIYRSVTKFKERQSEVEGGQIAGTWFVLDDGRYSVVLSSKQSKTTIEDDVMFVDYYSNIYAFRKMTKIDRKTDIRKK